MFGISDRFSSFLNLNKQETEKVIWLTLAFFCVIGGYTILKEIKDSLFVILTGEKESMYLVKLASLFFLIPATLLYSKLVDTMSQYRLLWFYAIVYFIAGVVIALLLNTSSVGLLGDRSFGQKAFGWFFYLFYEGANPFVVSLFWSFANSITPPNTAKQGYAVMISGSKLGGMATAGIAWSLFSMSAVSGAWLTDIFVYQVLLIGASSMLVIAPYVISKFCENSTEQSRHGYEAAYQADHKREETGTHQTGVLSGLKMMKKHSYIFGIFGMIFFYELINVVLAVQRIVIMEDASDSVAGFSGSLFRQRFLMHGVGFIISFFGTRPLIARLGERVCLLLIPVIMSCLLLYFMLFYNESAVLFVFMMIGTLNYAFSSPLRESLYIPTVRDIRFKAKAWIDSFGTKFSKGCAALLIGVVQYFTIPGSAMFMIVYSAIFTMISLLWIVLAWFLGRKYEQLISDNQVVGSED